MPKGHMALLVPVVPQSAVKLTSLDYFACTLLRSISHSNYHLRSRLAEFTPRPNPNAEYRLAGVDSVLLAGIISCILLRDGDPNCVTLELTRYVVRIIMRLPTGLGVDPAVVVMQVLTKKVEDPG